MGDPPRPTSASLIEFARLAFRQDFGLGEPEDLPMNVAHVLEHGRPYIVLWKGDKSMDEAVEQGLAVVIPRAHFVHQIALLGIGDDIAETQRQIVQSVVMPFSCRDCGGDLVPKGASAGPWDIDMEFLCSGCGRVCIVTFPSQQAVDYKRADSLAPIVEVSVD